MIERFNRTCLMMLSMFVNDWRDNWNELLPYVMHAYRTSVHESTGYSPFRLMMGEECSLPQDVSTAELRAHRDAGMPWRSRMITFESLHRTPAHRKRLYDIKAVNRKFPVGSWVLRYYPPAAKHKLGSPWIGPNQVVRQATGHTVGIQKGQEKPIVFVHVVDLQLCPSPQDVSWNPGVSTAKLLCASTVAFRPGSHVSDMTPTPSVDVSGWEETDSYHVGPVVLKEFDSPIDLTGHVLSPFYIRPLDYQDSRFHSIAHLMCYRYAVAAGQKTFATGIRKWSKHLTDFPTPKFKTINWIQQWQVILMDIYSHLCVTDVSVKATLINTGPHPFTLHCLKPWGYVPGDPDTSTSADLISDILIDIRVRDTSNTLTPVSWLNQKQSRPGMRNAAASLAVGLQAQK